jgi:hypothetical protein
MLNQTLVVVTLCPQCGRHVHYERPLGDTTTRVPLVPCSCGCNVVQVTSSDILSNYDSQTVSTEVYRSPNLRR